MLNSVRACNILNDEVMRQWILKSAFIHMNLIVQSLQWLLYQCLTGQLVLV
jgi:hypothetical protein